MDSKNLAIIYFTKRDLLDTTTESIDCVWDLPEVQKMLKNQLDDGSWPSKGKKDLLL